MELLDYFNTRDAFIRSVGAVMTRCEPGLAVLELDLEPRHMSDVGFHHAHAGLLYALAQSASAAAFLAYGYDGFSVEGTIQFFDTATEGHLTVTAKSKDTHDQETGKVRVTITAEDGRIIARVNFVSCYTGKPFLPA